MVLLASSLVTLDTPAKAGGPDFITFAGMAVIAVVFLYVTAWRPQQQEQKAREDMLASLAKDDPVVVGGIHGKVVEVHPDWLLVEIADKTRVKVERSAVTRKGGPAASKAADKTGAPAAGDAGKTKQGG